jgi:magnesium transporter
LIRSILYPDTVHRGLNPTHEEMKEALCKPEALLWVSLENPDASDISILRDVFKFHPLAIEDCSNDGYQAPKVDDFGTYLFLIAHAIHPHPGLIDLETSELDIFLGDNYLVTVYKGACLTPIDATFKRLERDERVRMNGSDFLCHAVLDKLVDEYMPVIDQMEDEIEWLEDQVLANPTSKTIARIIELKHSIMTLRRIISPMREVINRLSRDNFPMIDGQSRIYFRDIYDHLVRLQDLSDTIRDIVSGTMDIYLNSTSLKLNEVMKYLTITSTIFLPLSFIAGVYGMNFVVNYPPLDWQGGIIFFWLLCLAVAGGMLLFFKKRGWF